MSEPEPRRDGRHPPSTDHILAIGAAFLAALPEPFRELVSPVPITVEDWADETTLDSLEIDDPLDLTGLYRGIPIGERHAAMAPAEPEMIFLYRMPILVEWCERGCSLEEVVEDVLAHEIGHHFGMDEAAALRLEGRTLDD